MSLRMGSVAAAAAAAAAGGGGGGGGGGDGATAAPSSARNAAVAYDQPTEYLNFTWDASLNKGGATALSYDVTVFHNGTQVSAFSVANDGLSLELEGQSVGAEEFGDPIPDGDYYAAVAANNSKGYAPAVNTNTVTVTHAVTPQPGDFTDDFNRSDRQLSGDNGWMGDTGYSISGNQVVAGTLSASIGSIDGQYLPELRPAAENPGYASIILRTDGANGAALGLCLGVRVTGGLVSTGNAQKHYYVRVANNGTLVMRDEAGTTLGTYNLTESVTGKRLTAAYDDTAKVIRVYLDTSKVLEVSVPGLDLLNGQAGIIANAAGAVFDDWRGFPVPVAAFADDFVRSDRDLNGDNGWTTYTFRPGDLTSASISNERAVVSGFVPSLLRAVPAGSGWFEARVVGITQGAVPALLIRATDGDTRLDWRGGQVGYFKAMRSSSDESSVFGPSTDLQTDVGSLMRVEYDGDTYRLFRDDVKVFDGSVAGQNVPASAMAGIGHVSGNGSVAWAGVRSGPLPYVPRTSGYLNDTFQRADANPISPAPGGIPYQGVSDGSLKIVSGVAAMNAVYAGALVKTNDSDYDMEVVGSFKGGGGNVELVGNLNDGFVAGNECIFWAITQSGYWNIGEYVGGSGGVTATGVISISDTVKLRLKKVGTYVRGYVNDVLIWQGNLSAHATAKNHGFRGGPSAASTFVRFSMATPTPIPVPPPSPGFGDDFNRPDQGALTLGNGWSGSGFTLQSKRAIGRSYSSIAEANSVAPGTYDVASWAQALLQSGTEVGLIVNWIDANNYEFVLINAATGTFRAFATVGGSTFKQFGGSMSNGPHGNVPVFLRARRVSDGTITIKWYTPTGGASASGDFVFTKPDSYSSPAITGRFGLYSEANNDLAFAFTVTPVVLEMSDTWQTAVRLPKGGGVTFPRVRQSDMTVGYPIAANNYRAYGAQWAKFTATTANPVTVSSVHDAGSRDGYVLVYDGDPTVETGGSNTTNQVLQGSNAAGDPSVYSGLGAGTNLVAIADDNNSASASEGIVRFTPTVGKTYYIAQGSYGSSPADNNPSHLTFSGVNV